MKRKIVVTGSSLAITLPADIVRELGLEKGQEVDVSLHPVTKVLTVRTGVKLYEDGKVTSRARADIDRLLTRRAKLYERLAK